MVELVDGFDPLPVSPTDEKAFGFQIIKKTVLDMFPSITIAPGRMQEDSSFNLQKTSYFLLDLIISLNCKLTGNSNVSDVT